MLYCGTVLLRYPVLIMRYVTLNSLFALQLSKFAEKITAYKSFIQMDFKVKPIGKY